MGMVNARLIIVRYINRRGKLSNNIIVNLFKIKIKGG